MISIKQLKDNLSQSQRWGEVFRRDVKTLLEEITLTNHEIARLNKHNADMHASIDGKRRELKSQTDEKIKLKYKTDKLEIKLQEMQTRLKLYEDGLTKKEEWNCELSNRLMLLEIDLERERHALDEIDELDSHSQDKADSRVSSTSFNSTFLKENSIKKVLGHPRTHLDATLNKVKSLEDSYLKQSEKCRRLQQELQPVRRKGQRLQARLTELEISDLKQEKQNNKRSGLSCLDQNIPREARTKAKTLRQLQNKAQNLDKEITNLYQKIEQYSAVLTKLLKEDEQAGAFHRELAILEREVRKEKGTIHSMKTYILSECK